MRKKSFPLLSLFFSLFSYAQNNYSVEPGILQIVETKCSFRMAFGEFSIQKEDTIDVSYYNEHGRIVYEVVSLNNPSLSAVEMEIDPNDIESAMTHDMDYSNATSKKFMRSYRYNDNNQLEAIYTFTSYGKFTQLKKFTYDKFGVSVEDIFDAQNNLISKTKNNRSADGKKIDNVVYNGDGYERNKTHYELDAVGDTILKSGWLANIHFTYDKAHHCTSKYVVKEQQTRFKYDSHGNCILEYPYNYGSYSKTWVVGYPQTKYEYEYNDKGDWVTRKTYNIQTDVMSELDGIYKREVNYAKSVELHRKYMEHLESLFQKAYSLMAKVHN